MACNTHVKYCAKLFGGLRDLLKDPEFIARHRVSERDFTRRRSLPFSRLVAFLTNLVKGSMQDELDQFFGAMRGAPTAVRGAGKAALTQANGCPGTTRRRWRPPPQALIRRAERARPFASTHEHRGSQRRPPRSPCSPTRGGLRSRAERTRRSKNSRHRAYPLVVRAESMCGGGISRALTTLRTS